MRRTDRSVLRKYLKLDVDSSEVITSSSYGTYILVPFPPSITKTIYHNQLDTPQMTSFIISDPKTTWKRLLRHV